MTHWEIVALAMACWLVGIVTGVLLMPAIEVWASKREGVKNGLETKEPAAGAARATEA